MCAPDPALAAEYAAVMEASFLYCAEVLAAHRVPFTPPKADAAGKGSSRASRGERKRRVDGMAGTDGGSGVGVGVGAGEGAGLAGGDGGGSDRGGAAVVPAEGVEGRGGPKRRHPKAGNNLVGGKYVGNTRFDAEAWRPWARVTKGTPARAPVPAPSPAPALESAVPDGGGPSPACSGAGGAEGST